MSWKEKIGVLRNSALTDEKLMLVFDAAPGARTDFLAEVKRRAPFVPNSYLEFLRTTDGAQLDYFVLFGSGDSQFPSLFGANRAWDSIVDRTNKIVIGEDAAGSAFVLRRDGSVELIGTDPPDGTNARLVARSFDELLDDVFMGDRYRTLFPSGVRDDNDWLTALADRNWLSR